jgi:hypothetical protein
VTAVILREEDCLPFTVESPAKKKSGTVVAVVNANFPKVTPIADLKCLIAMHFII